MDINMFYSIVKQISLKNQQGYIGPDAFNNAVNLAQKQLMHTLVEDVQGWDANGRRIRLPMGNAQQSIQKISPFIVRDTTVTVPSDGVVNKPADLVHMLAVRYTGNKMVRRVEHDRVFSTVNSTIDLISDNPVYVEYADSYQVYPVNIGPINWEYIQSPADALWAYNEVNGRPVYDQANSVQLLWKDNEITELISRVLFMFGISLQAQNLIAYYQSIKNDGE